MCTAMQTTVCLSTMCKTDEVWSPWKIQHHATHDPCSPIQKRSVARRRRTEKKLSKKVRNHQVTYTVTTSGNSTALREAHAHQGRVVREVE